MIFLSTFALALLTHGGQIGEGVLDVVSNHISLGYYKLAKIINLEYLCFYVLVS